MADRERRWKPQAAVLEQTGAVGDTTESLHSELFISLPVLPVLSPICLSHPPVSLSPSSLLQLWRSYSDRNTHSNHEARVCVWERERGFWERRWECALLCDLWKRSYDCSHIYTDQAEHLASTTISHFFNANGLDTAVPLEFLNTPMSLLDWEQSTNRMVLRLWLISVLVLDLMCFLTFSCVQM